MKTSIMSSFFFLHMVENYKIFNRTEKIKSAPNKGLGHNRDKILGVFSVIYTIMETQAAGFPISEEDLEISAALVSAFSWEYCLGVNDPYVVTQIMWEAYSLGNINIGSRHYAKVHSVAKAILDHSRSARTSNA